MNALKEEQLKNKHLGRFYQGKVLDKHVHASLKLGQGGDKLGEDFKEGLLLANICGGFFIAG